MFRIAQWLAEVLYKSGFPCDDVNMFLADDEVAMQEVFNFHLHVFPRTKGDSFGLKFGEQYIDKPSRSDLEDAAEKIGKVIEQGASADAYASHG